MVDVSTIATDASRDRKDQPEATQKTSPAKEDIARPGRNYLGQLEAEAAKFGPVRLWFRSSESNTRHEGDRI